MYRHAERRALLCPLLAAAISLLITTAALPAQTGANVLLVVNQSDRLSRQIADYYRPRRAVPVQNVCALSMTREEEIPWHVYQEQIERPVGECLKKNGLIETVLYIVTTAGVPLKVDGAGSGMEAEHASVDSELALLYGKLKGAKYQRAGGVPNPLFTQRDARFGHPQFPIYLVTRLAAFDFTDVKGMIDRSLAAHNRGKFAIDLNSPKAEPGNDWLRHAALLLPPDRVVLDATAEVLYGLAGVIAYASWGSNDDRRKQRRLHFGWLPGAIALEYVSTSARTLKPPPDTWTYTTWEDKQHFYAGSPQGLAADLIHDGASAASGNTYEPYLTGCARPDYALPAYFEGRNLAESFYCSLMYLSWQSVVLGDPLMTLGDPLRAPGRR